MHKSRNKFLNYSLWRYSIILTNLSSSNQPACEPLDNSEKPNNDHVTPQNTLNPPEKNNDTPQSSENIFEFYQKKNQRQDLHHGNNYVNRLGKRTKIETETYEANETLT